MNIANEVKSKLIGWEEISDPDLRTAVMDVWINALEAGDYDSLAEIQLFPGVSQVSHQNDVTTAAIAFVDTISDRHPDIDVDRDLVIAGAILHDVSKLVEHSEQLTAPDGSPYLDHPYYAIHLLAEADLPPSLQHIVAAHTPTGSIETRTLEAEIVKFADEVVGWVVYLSLDEYE